MIEKGKISALQMSYLIYASLVTTAILMVPGITYKEAKQDLWLSPVWGSIAGFIVVFVSCQLHKLYPGEMLIQYSQHILGNIIGKVAGFFYLFYFLFLNGLIARQYGDFLVGMFLNRTPIVFVMGGVVLATSLTVRAGLEVLARLSDIIIPIVFLLWLLIVLLLIPDFEVKNLFPIMEEGILPSLKGAITPLTWNMGFILISTLLPFLNEREQGMKGGAFSVLALLVTLVMTNLATLLLFGRITGNFLYPVMNASRYISYADFFENLEAIVMAIWIMGMFLQIGIYQYVLVLNTAQWLNVSNYKPLALPYGLLICLFGYVLPNVTNQAQIFTGVLPFESLTFFVLIPVTMLLIALWRNRN